MKRRKKTAVVHCAGSAGKEACRYGCTGCGRCEAVCRKNAVRCREGAPAVVDRDLCIGCGLCVKQCPRQIISLEPSENTILVCCSNRDGAKEARSCCPVSCIGCGMCSRRCPSGAIRVLENCAVMDRECCIACGMCAAGCPRGVIHDAFKILTKD